MGTTDRTKAQYLSSNPKPSKRMKPEVQNPRKPSKREHSAPEASSAEEKFFTISAPTPPWNRALLTKSKIYCSMLPRNHRRCITMPAKTKVEKIMIGLSTLKMINIYHAPKSVGADQDSAAHSRSN